MKRSDISEKLFGKKCYFIYSEDGDKIEEEKCDVCDEKGGLYDKKGKFLKGSCNNCSGTGKNRYITHNETWFVYSNIIEGFSVDGKDILVIFDGTFSISHAEIENVFMTRKEAAAECNKRNKKNGG